VEKIRCSLRILTGGGEILYTYRLSLSKLVAGAEGREGLASAGTCGIARGWSADFLGLGPGFFTLCVGSVGE